MAARKKVNVHTNGSVAKVVAKMGSYEIMEGIPVPGDKVTQREILESLKVGQSVLFGDLKVHSVYVLASAAHKRTGHTFTTRTTPSGARVWRVK